MEKGFPLNPKHELPAISTVHSKLEVVSSSAGFLSSCFDDQPAEHNLGSRDHTFGAGD